MRDGGLLTEKGTLYIKMFLQQKEGNDSMTFHTFTGLRYNQSLPSQKNGGINFDIPLQNRTFDQKAQTTGFEIVLKMYTFSSDWLEKIWFLTPYQDPLKLPTNTT